MFSGWWGLFLVLYSEMLALLKEAGLVASGDFSVNRVLNCLEC